MRRSAATALTLADVELRDNGSGLLQVHRSNARTHIDVDALLVSHGEEGPERQF